MTVRGVDGADRELSLPVGERSRADAARSAACRGWAFEIWRPRVKPIIGLVNKGTAGERRTESGRRDPAIDGQQISHFQQLVNRVKPNPGRTVTLQVRRDGAVRDMKVTIGEESKAGRKTGLIGIAPKDQRIPTGRTLEDMLTLQKYSPVAAVGQAAAKTWDTPVFTLRIVGRIITGDVSLQAISGPISIAENRGFAARQAGARSGTLALISISLGVLNLPPIPILDGGQGFISLRNW
jgi:regulator of sigma E protease